MSYRTSPKPFTSTTASSSCTNDGTFVRVTARAAPSSTWTSTVTRPAGVSRRIVVTGSTTSTMPVSTSTVATPMVPWPHIGRHPLTSM